MEQIKALVSNNVIPLITFIFVCGSFYNEMKTLTNNQKILDQRLDKKIKIINELQDKIVDLEKKVYAMNNCK